MSYTGSLPAATCLQEDKGQTGRGAGDTGLGAWTAQLGSQTVGPAGGWGPGVLFSDPASDARVKVLTLLPASTLSPSLPLSFPFE